MMLFRFATNFSPKDDQRVAMITISGNDLRNCVATGKEDCECQRNGQVGTPRCGVRSAQRADPTIDLRGEQQTKWRDKPKKPVYAVLWNQRHPDPTAQTPANTPAQFTRHLAQNTAQ